VYLCAEIYEPSATPVKYVISFMVKIIKKAVKHVSTAFCLAIMNLLHCKIVDWL